jgi:hypothetical protein
VVSRGITSDAGVEKYAELYGPNGLKAQQRNDQAIAKSISDKFFSRPSANEDEPTTVVATPVKLAPEEIEAEIDIPLADIEAPEMQKQSIDVMA